MGEKKKKSKTSVTSALLSGIVPHLPWGKTKWERLEYGACINVYVCGEGGGVKNQAGRGKDESQAVGGAREVRMDGVQ